MVDEIEQGAAAETPGDRLKEILGQMMDGKPVQRTDAMAALAMVKEIAWWDDEPVWAPAPNLLPGDLKEDEFLLRDAESLPRECWERHLFNLQQPGGHGLALQDKAAFVAIYQGKHGLRFLVGYQAA